MFLRAKIRKKDGKRHRYWSVVENKRVAGGRVVQKHVLHLGEINDSQELAWRRSIEVLDEEADRPKTLALFPEDRCAETLPDASIVRLKLSQLRLCRPRQWGACWLALSLWEELRLDRFWSERLPASRKGTRWDQELFVLVAYRLLAPGSEWRLHREWFERTALADLLGGDFGLAEIHKLYRCHDRLLEHKEALFHHLTERWRDLFAARFDLLLYDLTSTYFEAEPPFAEGDKRRFGYSRDHRPDCVQVVIALVVTPEGLPLAYEVLSGNTADKTTLRDFLAKIERQYGKARRVWVMDRGIPTEETLAEMRAGRSARAVSGRRAEGTPEPARARPRRQALAGGAPRRRGQAVAPGRRTLRVRPEPRPGRQGAQHAPAATERPVGAAERAAQDVRQPDARRPLDQARTGQGQVAGRMAAGRGRDRPEAGRVPICARSQEAAAGAPARRALSAAQQSDRGRSRRPVELLPPAGPGGGSVSDARRATSPSARSTIRSSGASRRTSSSPSSPIACTSPSAAA